MTNTTVVEPASTKADEQRPSVLRSIPLDQITIVPGFNPRGGIDQDAEEFVAFAESIRAEGVLTPIRVAETGPNRYDLIAGERRLLAARKAAHATIPAAVEFGGDELDRHARATAENSARSDMNPVADARAYHRLAQAKWSVTEIARHVGRSKEHVADRLRIIELPEALYERITTKAIPLFAIKALADLAAVHPDLPTVFVARLLDHRPLNDRVFTTWDAALRDPVAVLSSTYKDESCALPDGIHATVGIPVPALNLTDEARINWQIHCKHRQKDPETGRMWLDDRAVGQAVALSATYPLEPASRHLILGTDVLVQIVSDVLAAEAKTISEEASSRPSTAVSTGKDKTPEQKRNDREAEQKERAAALVHNKELGAAVWGSLLNIEVDDAVLHALLVAQPLDELGRLAEAGARYCLPGWATETQVRNRTKIDYPKITECRRLANEFLAGADDRASRAGRCFALLAMARYADQRAVAVSSRSYYSLALYEGDSPWDVDPRDLIDDVCKGLLPAHLTKRAIDDRKKDRARDEQRRARRKREAREKDAARKRLNALNGKFDGLDAAALKRVVADATLVFGASDPKAVTIKQAVTKIRAARRRAAKATAKTKKGASSAQRRKTGGNRAPRKEVATV